MKFIQVTRKDNNQPMAVHRDQITLVYRSLSIADDRIATTTIELGDQKVEVTDSLPELMSRIEISYRLYKD